MTNTERELSNLSYTNKDFGTIYPELLNLAKKISYKWDPTVSDESDPGVVLLKLCALMADKNNYNIDKNVLELYPLSVTQNASAREIFDQCGYSMKYYQSATTSINFYLVSEPSGVEEDPNLNTSNSLRIYHIPRFTMISDSNNEIVYTITEDAYVKSDGSIETVEAIEGKLLNYDINGELLITAENLDYNNRLYFSYLDIPENGIFIRNSGKNNWQDWERVDNLTVQPVGSTKYKFGLTKDGSMCYIEFPSDIDTLIGDGLYINYVRTSGKNGNVSYRQLNQFYTDTKAVVYLNSTPSKTSEYDITCDNIHISNSTAATNGSDPESIDSAYKNYQKTKGTFDTLVSLNDYTNFIYTKGLVSNGYVCDRTNDPQSSYTILEGTNTYTKTHHVVKKDDNTGNDEMSAFDLKIYGLKYVDDPTTGLESAFDYSFTLMETNTSEKQDYYWLTEALKDVKCIQHEYKSINSYEPAMFKNKFNLVVTVFPQYNLTDTQKSEVIQNIRSSLCKELYSRSIDFGYEVDFDLVYNTIMKSDPRVKAVSLNSPKYETYAVYVDDKYTMCELRIDSESTQPELKDGEEESSTITERYLWKKFRDDIIVKSILAGKTPLFNSKNSFSYPLIQNNPQIITTSKISTNVDIEIPIGENHIGISSELRNNENILLTAVNLITDQTYGSYVKYIYNLETAVSRDTDYTLQDEEYIVFFWKSEDGDDIPYTYYKYSGSTSIKIFSPTFNLKQSQNEPNTSLGLPGLSSLKSTLQNLPVGKGSTEIYKVNEQTSLSDYISKLSGNEYVLSGSNTITTKKPNTVVLNSDTNKVSNLFWILNNKNNTLFEKGQTERILESGEYLFYTNIQRTQLIVVGSGTIIKRDSKDNGVSWSVESITFDKLVENGYLSYLNGEIDGQSKWFDITDKNIEYTETQYYQLGPGNKLKIVDNSSKNYTSVLINSDGIRVKTTAEDYTNLSTTVHLRFSYIDDQGNETVLPEKTSEETSWIVKSILSIDASSTKYQTVELNQSITIYDDEDKEIKLTDVTFFTNRDLTTIGGNSIDVSSYDTSMNITPLTIYSFKYPNSLENSWLRNELQYSLNHPGNSATVTTNTTLLNGKYVIPVTITATGESSDKLKVTISASNSKLKDITGLSEFEQGIYYLLLDIKGDDDIELSIEAKQKCTITFSQLYMYVETDKTDQTFMKKISYLDKNRYFNYLYQVPTEDLIEDPLDSYSFFNTNHIYNKFTIAQWKAHEDSTKFMIMNKIR